MVRFVLPSPVRDSSHDGHEMQNLDTDGRTQPRPPGYDGAGELPNDGNDVADSRAREQRRRPARHRRRTRSPSHSQFHRLCWSLNCFVLSIILFGVLMFVLFGDASYFDLFPQRLYQHEWYSLVSIGSDSVQVKVLQSSSPYNDTLRQFCGK